jgi:hypothetical protein
VGRRTWTDLTPRQRKAVLILGTVQLSLAASAWADLAMRTPDQVNGRKAVWAAVIAINVVGPLAWFRSGHREMPASRGRRIPAGGGAPVG